MFKKIDLYKLVNWTRYSVKRASKVLTISKASKADIMHFYNLDSGKIKVVYPGVKMKSEIRNSKPETVLKKYGITKEYILYVGTLQPRKNLVRLIEAFDKVNSQLSTLNSQLVIVGRKGWMYDEIFAKVKELKLGKNVIFTGFVPDRDLPIFYKNAKLLALVSLYEGFGLPILEAMSYGTPVVVSNISSLPEVAGDAGVYVDPNDTGDIAKGIRKVLIMDKKQYENLSKKSKQQASKFSWERTARQILKVLEEVASS